MFKYILSLFYTLQALPYYIFFFSNSCSPTRNHCNIQSHLTPLTWSLPLDNDPQTQMYTLWMAGSK